MPYLLKLVLYNSAWQRCQDFTKDGQFVPNLTVVTKKITIFTIKIWRHLPKDDHVHEGLSLFLQILLNFEQAKLAYAHVIDFFCCICELKMCCLFIDCCPQG